MIHRLLIVLLAVCLSGGTASLYAEAAGAAEGNAVTSQAADAAGDPAAAGETVEAEPNALVQQFVNGGAPMWFLLALSILGGVIIIERLINLGRGSIVPEQLARNATKLWDAGQHDALAQQAKKDGSTLAKIILYCLANRDADRRAIDDGAAEIVDRDLRRHSQANYWLAIVATLAPLLGLLGTVIGMIKSFKVVEIAGDIGDISLVAGGISQALVTTAAGLIIAVPALGLYHVFRVRTNGLGVAVEETGSALIERWFPRSITGEG